MPIHTTDHDAKVSAPAVTGQRYRAEIPDTFDLVDRARLAINVMTRAVEPRRHYAVWHEMFLSHNPPHFRWSNWLTYKFIEALARMRQMTGDTWNIDVDHAMLQTYVDRIGPHGLLYYPSLSPDNPPNTAYAIGCARMILSMAALHERDGDPGWLDLMRNMAHGLDHIAIRRFHYAYYPLESGYATDGTWAYTRRGGGRADYFPYTPPDEPAREQQGHEGCAKFEAGTTVRALIKTYELTGDERSLELARKLSAYMLLPTLWENSWPHGAPDHEHGIFAGHFHGNTMPIRGLLELAIATGDSRLKTIVHEAYEYACASGLRRVGWFPTWIHPERFGRSADSEEVVESCAVGNMIALAIRLTDAGLGDYWDDVDHFVRNQLAELQLADLPRMQAVAEYARTAKPRLVTMGPPNFLNRLEAADWVRSGKPLQPLVTDLEDPWGCDLESVPERTLGGFGMAPLEGMKLVAAYSCCTGNGSLGLYYAWEGAVRCRNGVANVNLLLNRASPWLDVDSYLPYEGRVRILVKTAHTVATRIPGWVAIESVAATLDGAPVSPGRIGRYLVLDGLKPGQAIEFRFAVPHETSEYSAHGERYRFAFRGSTVVSVQPELTEPGTYAFFRRDGMEAEQAPMKTVERFVADPG